MKTEIITAGEAMPKAKIVKVTSYNGHPVFNVKGEGSNARILDKADAMFDYMLGNHAKVLATRFDAHYPQDMDAPGDNRHISRLCCDLTRECRREYGDFMTLWVPEQTDESKNPHFHVLALSDGRNNKSPVPILRKAERTLARVLDATSAKGLIDWCDRTKDGQHQSNGIMLRKDDPDFDKKVEDCRRWASYLGKCSSKRKIDGVRSFGGSEIPKAKKVD